MEYVTLNNGVQMPIVGFGVVQLEDADECRQCGLDALEEG